MEDYNVISYHGHDIKVIENRDTNKIYFETELYEMGEAVKVGQAYDLKYADYTENELAVKIEELMREFLSFYEACK